MNVYEDWNFWLTIVTIIVAIIALFQSSKNTNLSNKQHLFDKRVETYIVVKGIIELFAQNEHLLDKENVGPMFANDLIFVFLTNNVYMEKTGLAIKKPLSNPEQRMFLAKLESLKELSLKIRLLFSNSEADLLSDFITKYQKLLFKMYQYQIVLERMHEENEKTPMSVERASELVNEVEERSELLGCIKQIRESFRDLKHKNVEQSIYNQIKLD